MDAPAAAAWVRRLETWVHREPTVRVALLVGSQARAEMPADPFSDIDLALFVREPPLFLRDATWVSELGAFWTSHTEPNALASGEERRVLFEDGQDVDFAVFPVAELDGMLSDPRAAAVLQRGFRVLVDKDARGLRFQAEAVPPARLSPDEVANLTNDYWFHLVWTAKKLRRGELLTALEVVNGYLRSLLVQTIRWHARTCGPPQRDVWHAARFFEKWADPRAIREFSGTVAAYDAQSVAHALRGHRALFSWVVRDLYAALGMHDPIRNPEGLGRYLDRLLELWPDDSR